MKTTAEFRKRFLTDTSETGRFVVTSLVTGKKWFVEAIDNASRPAQWGDIDPATKTIQGSYGHKYKGSVTEKESMITKENGFDKIHVTQKGESPFGVIDRLDREYQLSLQ